MRYEDQVEAARDELGITFAQWERIPGYVRDGIIAMARSKREAHERADAAQEHDLTTYDWPLRDEEGIYVARDGAHVKYPPFEGDGTQGIVTFVKDGESFEVRMRGDGSLVVNANMGGISVEPTAGNEIRVRNRRWS